MSTTDGARDADTATNTAHGTDTESLPWWLQLSLELEGADSDALANRYYELAEQKLAAETRAGQHPAGHDNPKNIDPDRSYAPFS